MDAAERLGTHHRRGEQVVRSDAEKQQSRGPQDPSAQSTWKDPRHVAKDQRGERGHGSKPRKHGEPRGLSADPQT